MKKKSAYIVLGLVLLLIIPIASAGWWSSLQKSITGRATSQLTNVSFTVSGVNPIQIIYVAPISATNPTEATYTNVSFEVRVKDIDGVADINFTSVYANFSRTGEPTEKFPNVHKQNKY